MKEKATKKGREMAKEDVGCTRGVEKALSLALEKQWSRGREREREVA